ncbi:hypothetical protein BKN37_07245 [Mycobacterium talmoniae]|uniref:Uncharacterized protein n=1 Tax=Mycobacterium talmoniae TaxID=1858794 RepID=A0A1S1NQH6_9MYCO|nr:hypothetical protein BKN37_07245 [Mycobacterium talmoniae]
MVLGLAFVAAGPLISLSTAPLAAAHDPECDTMMPVGDQLEASFDQVEPEGVTPPGVGNQIIDAKRPLDELSSQPAVDLRNWSDILASKLNHDGRYAQQGPDELWLAADLGAARSHLLAARRYCIWGDHFG